MKIKYLPLLLAAFLILPGMILARVGVGVGSGKINVDQILKPGMIYQLPVLPVINTGDETSEYEITIQYHTQQSQLKPQADWFYFGPQLFELGAGQTKNVAVEIKLPLKAVPGDYFAYIEAHPRTSNEGGTASVGIAAAAKLYFTVAPANFFEGLYYRVTGFMAIYSPWTWIVFFTILSLAFLAVIKKFFSFKVNVSFKKN